ncbi:hypothetical protein DSCW_53760 [Desulfosarcina widdelii]|uniref:Uncharacterized protein n=1 Tax=Desulfosarcina widdelii TaxID=947919 RepID=A0A5K7ZCQ0_9BACT|nr:hypothetical protein [Desulfosarcina widdelii]BBO77959.1 hypothetical protein DSCW_53760 [Desulfosarcina widdelii]
MSHLKALTFALLFTTLFQTPFSNAYDVPEPLAPWKEWVLYDKQTQTCPSHFNDGSIQRCWWPSRLAVDAAEQGAAFDMQVEVYAPIWVMLPGDGEHWPESVFDGKNILPVVERNDRPAIWLEPGDHRIRGALVWNALPEVLSIPQATGMVSLKMDGKDIAEPEWDEKGRLRLNGKNGATRREGTHAAMVFRLIEDDIPLRMVTQVLLRVSGPPREIRLAALLPDAGAVMRIDSPLPLHLAENRDLLVQARTGRWELRVTVRMEGPVTQLSTGKGDYGPEIWSFKAYNHLRMVNVTGAPTVEPSRTQMPDEWKTLPAYQIKTGGGLNFETVRRGDPDPAPDQLELQRTWWLDFDGTGFTLHDRITGTLNRTWHLAMNPPVELGRVAVDEENQLITRHEDRPGIELRRGNLSLAADSRMTRTASVLPAVGWDHDFNRVSGVLNLPPGWSLLSTTGVDVPPNAWLQRWTLLDLFLVLIVAVSAYKLRDRRTGILVLVTLGLIFHEPGAPRLVWLHLLVVAALLKYLPQGWFKKIVRLWGVGVVIVLVVIAVPFMVQQVRTAVYPQLDRSGGIGLPMIGAKRMAVTETDRMAEAHRPARLKSSTVQTMRSAAGALPSKISSELPRRELTAKDPDALIQTGPGLPTWRWHSVPLRWNGPVDRNQQIRIWLISPGMNLVLGFIRTILLLALIVVVLEPRRWKKSLPPVTANALGALLLTALILSPTLNLRAESPSGGFPPQTLLDELQRRLLEPPVCLPHCADVSRLELAATPDQIRLILQVHTLTETAIPLPAGQKAWNPSRIVLDGAPAESLARDERGILWTVMPKGVHEIKLIGTAAGTDEVRIAFPLPPHTGTYAGVGWMARGIHSDGTVDASVVLTRSRSDAQPQGATVENGVPPFFQVSRTLRLGLQWEVDTRIQRRTKAGTPTVLSVPLLIGEAVTTAGIHVQEGSAQIAMGPDEVEKYFSGTLPVTPVILLAAPKDVPWTEVWTLDAAAIWRCSLSGLTVVHHQDAGRNFQPQWHPWPGEQVTIEITRPPAVPGRTVTLDSARLEMTPGQRFTRSVLDLDLRSSKGDHHQIELPAQANLQAVRIDGKSLPIRQDGQLVSVPLQPGSQAVQVQWQQLTDSLIRLKGPKVNAGGEAVNAAVTFRMPDNRWILFAGGPRLGPAVLFWSYVLVVVLVALGLGKTDIAPLRTHHWLLLGMGLTQVPSPVAVLIVGWLLALGYRCRMRPLDKALAFNFIQLLLAALTLAALIGLYTAIERGLLGIPEMQIAGNHSTRLQLHWTQDRIDGFLPSPWVVSLPLWTYRLLMLAWSLWLAFSLVSWLRWGWGCFSRQQLWKPIRWHLKIKFPEKEKKREEKEAKPQAG